ncbi:MAG: dTDP-4-dehydrorhamnose reductase [Pseudomonadota bacterium]
MRIAVTGSKGQVATALQKWHGREGVDVLPIARPEFDLANPANATEVLRRTNPDVVVNAAAFTAVDKAETEKDLAFQINALGAEAVARAAGNLGVPVIQISTDYVFSGEKETPYVETDPTGPINVYGASKLEGEQRVAAANPKHVILRTSWVYSETGSNFLKTMIRLAVERDEVSVVNDQFGAPTHADEIARSIVSVAQALPSESSAQTHFGVYHMTARGGTSWHGFASKIFATLADCTTEVAKLNRISSSAYPTAAGRPMNSRLRCERFESAFGHRLPLWSEPISAAVRAVSLNMA